LLKDKVACPSIPERVQLAKRFGDGDFNPDRLWKK